MSAPLGAGAGRNASVHAVAADALASLFAQGERWPPEAPQRFRNLLLDACGSDHRPLIDLLLRVGRHGLVSALQSQGTVRTSEWPARRTTLVSMVVGELFVNADIATWAVDAWAVALGVVPRDAANALRAEYAARAASVSGRVERVPTPRARSASGARGAAAGAATGGAKAPTPTASYVPGAPSWAGGPPAPRVGAWVRGAPTTGMPRWRVPSAGSASMSGSAVRPPDFAGFFVLMCLFGVFMLGFVMLMRASSAEFAESATGVEQTSLPTVASPDGASPVGAATVGGSTVGAAPVGTSTAAASTSAASTAMSAPNASTDATSVVADTARVAVDSTTLARSPSVSDSLRASRGADSMATVEPRATLSNTPSPNSAALSAPIASLAGRYRVERRILAVNGNSMCTPVADALQNTEAMSEEEFAQTAGSKQFELISRPGVVGTLQSDGTFATAPHSGTHDGVRYSFRMVGRTTPNGFVARTYTETEAVIRYRRTQRCMVIADLIGARR